MQPTRPKLRLREIRASRAAGGTAACSGRSTIGARVPSTSVRNAEEGGAARSGNTPSPPASPAPLPVSGDTPPSIAAMSAERVPSERTLKLAAIGTVAGIFSGLFGVGGGTVIVPLLILWFGYGERLATGTSLGAIFIIGLLGTIAQGGIR